MSGSGVITELVDRFKNNLDAYKSAGYNEAQLRQEFINPMFEALGWDVNNKQGFAEAYKDVIHEDAIKVGGATKAPDYSFRIGGARKFFLETKKPSVNIKDDPEPAFQLRRYAWSAKLPLSVLTDFEEFAVYDCRIKPAQGDKASAGRIMYLGYDEYTDRWDEIANIFSRNAILKGAFDKYADNTRGKKGTAEVDDAFLKEIESWRDAIARNVALRNEGLTERDINYAVQLTIDRIIFLRICEDRGIEEYGRLMALQNGEHVYKRMVDLYYRADEKYNSGLFHFQKEKGRPGEPDELTPDLKIDDKVLKDIIKGLYYPESPYEFSVLPVDILGHVYERFLGKVIRLTPGGRAKVEEKPEVRKAGGVYYTPKYIVEYIVENTVGRLLWGDVENRKSERGNQKRKLTPKQAAKLRILDPACGSGSFLIGAYEYLLDWHRDWYVENDPLKHKKQIYQGAGGQWYLTTAEKKKILLNNIYGVDIDGQAVEVTKLNLLLKALEGESEETIESQLKMFRERALPDLRGNIKCGNSLIGPDFYDNTQLDLLDDEERYRINVFDWDAEFGEVMKDGGFDVVIGNPPWLMAGYYIKDSLKFIRDKYKTAEGKFDLYYIFIEISLNLLGNKGYCGMIIPNKFFHTKAATQLRLYLSKSMWIDEIVDFGDEQIFDRATNYSCILFLRKLHKEKLIYKLAKKELKIIDKFLFPTYQLSGDPWQFEDENVRKIFNKVDSIGVHLESIVERFGTGVQSGADRIYTLDSNSIKENKIEKEIIKVILRGRDVRRFKISDYPKYLIFPYRVKYSQFVIMDEDELKRYRNTYELLFSNKHVLSKRKWFGKNSVQLSGKWFGLMYLDSYSYFNLPHILTPSLSNKSNFALGTGDLFLTGTAGVTSIIPQINIDEDILYLLGVLNSRLISYYIIKNSPIFSGNYYKFSAPYLKKVPIRRINFSNSYEIKNHDKIVSLVKNMLELQKQLPATKSAHEKTTIQRQIDATDKKIDELVYELYGLTKEERRVVEG